MLQWCYLELLQEGSSPSILALQSISSHFCPSARRKYWKFQPLLYRFHKAIALDDALLLLPIFPCARSARNFCINTFLPSHLETPSSSRSRSNTPQRTRQRDWSKPSWVVWPNRRCHYQKHWSGWGFHSEWVFHGNMEGPEVETEFADGRNPSFFYPDILSKAVQKLITVKFR